jgi:hypothetical protein
MKAGDYIIEGDGIRISQSGILIRGEVDDNGIPSTTLHCKNRNPSTLFQIEGTTPPKTDFSRNRVAVTAIRVPVGATVIPIEDATRFSPVSI